MQLPDEAISYQYQALLVPAVEESWSPAAELRSQHFLAPARLRDFAPKVLQVRSQVAAEREMQKIPVEMRPMQPGFIDLPQKILDQHRRTGEASTLGRVLSLADQMKREVDNVVLLGIGGSYMGARALFEGLRSSYHNQLPHKDRSGIPRIFFAGDNVDNDVLHELFDMLQITCIEPEQREECWGVVVISKSGGTLETAAAYRAIRREMAEYYGNDLNRIRQLVIPITGDTGKLRDLCKAEKFTDEQMLTIPDDIGGRYSIFTPVGLLPAALMGLDVRALLLGAAAMTRRFLEEPFERNPVLQYAAVNYLMAQERGKNTRVLSIWSKKLEAVGMWYDQLLSESLGKCSTGPTPITAVETRDLHSRGQQHQDGTRDKVINNLVLKGWKHPPIMIGMMDRNEDGLNALNRKGLPDIMDAALRGTNQAYFECARPTAELIIPSLSEHTMGQLLQLFMLATVVEGRLMGINPYGQPGVESYKKHMGALLQGS